jgi:hypothetical protein
MVRRSICMSEQPPRHTKAFVTLGVLAVCLVARNIPLPTVTLREGLGQGGTASQSIMALGAQPLLIGYVLVELLALLVPAWRPLRQGGPAGRAKLNRASLIVGMLLALGQAWVLIFSLERTGAAYEPGAGFRVITVVILLGATAAQVVLARIVDGEGLGSGFTILVLAAVLPQIFGPIGRAFTAVLAGVIPFSALLNGALGVAVLVGGTLWIFSPYFLPLDETWPHPALISRPACGVAPLTVVPGIMLLASTLTWLHHSGATWQVPVYPRATAVLIIVAAIPFAFMFNRPGRIVEAWKALSPNPPEGIPVLKAVTLESVLFIALAVAVQGWLVQRLGRGRVPNATPIILLTGVICDVMREWRADETDAQLTPIWEIHQVYAVAPAMRLLVAEGIQAFAGGLRLRSLLQFFGPYVPVQILVPADQAQAAYALLQARWPRWEGSA